jgi:hypothetical protein
MMKINSLNEKSAKVHYEMKKEKRKKHEIDELAGMKALQAHVSFRVGLSESLL